MHAGFWQEFWSPAVRDGKKRAGQSLFPLFVGRVSVGLWALYKQHLVTVGPAWVLNLPDLWRGGELGPFSSLVPQSPENLVSFCSSPSVILQACLCGTLWLGLGLWKAV